MSPDIDYDALARKFGGSDVAAPDYDALARKFGGSDVGVSQTSDALKSLAVSPLKGLVNLAGIGGNLRDLAEAGQSWIANKLGVDPTTVTKVQQMVRDAMPFMNLPSSADIMPGYEAISNAITGGPIYQPQTPAGKTADIAGQTATAMGRNLITAPVRTGAVVAGSTAGNRIAGGMTADNPWVEALGGLVGGGIPGAALAYRNAPAKALSQAVGDLTPQQMRDAIARQNNARALGIPLMGPEALPDSGVQQLAADVAASRSGGAVVKPFIAQRPNQVRQAVAGPSGMLESTGAPDAPFENVGRAQQAATDVFSNLERQRTDATRPLYQAASQDTAPDASIQAIIEAARQRAQQTDPQFAKALTGFASDISTARPAIPAGAIIGENGAPLVPGVAASSGPRTALGPLSDTYKRVRNSLDMPAINATPEDRIAQGVLGPFNQDLGTALREASPSWEAANHAYQQFTKTRIEPLQNSPLGIVAGRTGYDPTAPSAVPRVIGAISNPSTARQENIRDLYTQLNAQNPQAFPGIARTWLQNAFDDATQRVQGGDNRMLGANFAKSLFGTDQQRANFEEVLRGVARANGVSPGDYVAGANKLMQTLEATGRIPGVGSPTAGRADLAGQLGKSRLADAASAVSTHPFGFLASRIQSAMLAGRYNKLAEVFTAPDSVQQIAKMARLDPRGVTAQYYAAALLGIDRAASAD
ncbi:MAG TPA: hypothetical protein VGK37_04090 [Casimicrobiaceae bacterium]|jgi:hypothetical protein